MLKGISRKLLLSHITVAIIVLGVVGSFFYYAAHLSVLHSLKSRLLTNAVVVCEMLDVDSLDSIQAQTDVDSEVYQSALKQLRQVVEATPDLAYVYIMRLKNNQVEFVVDSDSSEDQALPGYVYKEYLPALITGFEVPSVDEQINTDEWGSFLSGYAPLKIHGSKYSYVLGVDMDAQDVISKFRDLRTAGFVSIVLVFVLAALLSRLLSKGLVSRIQILRDECEKMSRWESSEATIPQKGDELASLMQSFSDMAKKLQDSMMAHVEVEDALKQSNEELEGRVENRTEELERVNASLVHEIDVRKQLEEKRAEDLKQLQETMERLKVVSGLLPICASCKKIRDDRGYWNELESYIEAHSEAVFSHGICPDCVNRLYPENKPIKKS